MNNRDNGGNPKEAADFDAVDAGARMGGSDSTGDHQPERGAGILVAAGVALVAAVAIVAVLAVRGSDGGKATKSATSPATSSTSVSASAPASSAPPSSSAPSPASPSAQPSSPTSASATTAAIPSALIAAYDGCNPGTSFNAENVTQESLILDEKTKSLTLMSGAKSDFAVLECVAGKLGMPADAVDAMRSRVDEPRQQTVNWDALTAQWIYNANSGLNLYITGE